jgi:hypothetical protein
MTLKAVLLLLSSVAFTMARADDVEVVTTDAQRKSSHTELVIDSKTQALSGLKTILAKPLRHNAEFEAIGKVVSIQPLLALRERYLVAQAELNGAKAKLKQADQSLKRQEALYRQGIAAKRSLQEQQALGLVDKATIDVSYAKLMAIANEAQLLWGKELAEWVLIDKVAKVKEFLLGQQQLLQITLPSNKQLANEIKTIAIEPYGQRNKARPGVLISRANQVDNNMQGESYFFQVKGDGLNVGMKVSAWIPEPTLGQTGVVVPESALIWYLDQAYVYIKVSKDAFIRRTIKSFSVAPGGYFIIDDLKTGEEIVTTGGQMLLSEELRGQLPDED